MGSNCVFVDVFSYVEWCYEYKMSMCQIFFCDELVVCYVFFFVIWIGDFEIRFKQYRDIYFQSLEIGFYVYLG